MRRRPRWRRVATRELRDITTRLATWPEGGAERHMFALATIEAQGAEPVRIVEDGDLWAAAIVFPGRLVVPCGDPAAIAAAQTPARRWRLLISDEAAGDALLSRTPDVDQLIVHDQRLMVVDHARVPSAHELPDPGLRRAQAADVDRLATLAVRLHVDDRFGPDPGIAGWSGYRQRLDTTVRQGLVWCVGPVGEPVCKVEWSVSSTRWGAQLAGIVVDPAHRHEGLGRAAVAAAVRGVFAELGRDACVSLHVRTANERAIAAYAACGFVDREAWRLAVRP